MPIRGALKKAEAWFVHLLHLSDSAHRIAFGVGIGTFIALTPTIGAQMLLTVLVATLLRANKVSGVPMAWITNPLTAVPIYSFNYVVGRALVGGPGLKEVEGAMAAAMNPDLEWGELVRAWWDLMLHAAGPLWVGCVLVGLAAGIVAYGAMYYLVATYRRRYKARLRALLAKRRLERGGLRRLRRARRERPDEPPPPAPPAAAS